MIVDLELLKAQLEILIYVFKNDKNSSVWGLIDFINDMIYEIEKLKEAKANTIIVFSVK